MASSELTTVLMEEVKSNLNKILKSEINYLLHKIYVIDVVKSMQIFNFIRSFNCFKHLRLFYIYNLYIAIHVLYKRIGVNVFNCIRIINCYPNI